MHVTNNRDPLSSAIAAAPPSAPPKLPSRPEPPPGPQPGPTLPSPPAAGQAGAEQLARLDDHIRQLDQALTQLAGSLPPPPGGSGPSARVNKIEALTIKQRMAENPAGQGAGVQGSPEKAIKIESFTIKQKVADNGPNPAEAARKHIGGVKYEPSAVGGAGAFIKIDALRDAGKPVEGAWNAFLKIERREAGGGATLVNPELHRPPTV